MHKATTMNRRLATLLTAATLALGTYATSTAAEKIVVPDELKQRVQTEGWSQKWHDELYRHADKDVGAVVQQMLRAKRYKTALKSGLVVHEWGAMQHHVDSASSDFDLIGEDQSDLPNFVKVWADQPMLTPQVIKKPILYPLYLPNYCHCGLGEI